jgi:hypothetical protein
LIAFPGFASEPMLVEQEILVALDRGKAAGRLRAVQL